MPFSQAPIFNTQVNQANFDLNISWSCNSDSTTCYQVYIDRILRWYGHTQYCILPLPTSKNARNIWVEIGIVSPNEAITDFSSFLALNSLFGDRARLNWLGGSYLDTTHTDQVIGYKIFGEQVESVLGTNAPLADISSYPGSWISDGYGMGGYGEGGYGRSATNYSWTSESLDSGQWFFAVAPYDSSGRRGDLSPTISLTVKSAPLPPMTGSLQLVYNGHSNCCVQLTWNPRI